MRLSELLGLDVRDSADSDVGTVIDVRLVRDGPPRGTGMARLRVAGLVVSPRHSGRLLGYERTPKEGPWLVRIAVMAFHKGVHYVPWEWVASCDQGIVRATAAAADIPALRDLPGAGPVSD